MIHLDLSLPQFVAKYSDEEACLMAIFEAQWPRGYICPYCGHNDGIRLKSRPRVIQCPCCRRQSSILANTIFRNTHLPLTSWFLALYLVAQDKGGDSALRLVEQLGVSQPTAWLLLQKVRICMGDRDEKLTLAGLIELDEAFFGGRRTKKTHSESPFAGKVEVLVMVESENMAAGNLVMKVIPDDSMESLKPVIAAKIESEPPGQHFRADGLGRHHVVCTLGHKITMGPMTKVEQDSLMACVNLAIKHAKEFLKGTYHHFCRMHIQRYLDEFCYRWNRRHLGKAKASHLILACVLHQPAPWNRVAAPKVLQSAA